VKSWIQVHITVKSWKRLGIKVMRINNPGFADPDMDPTPRFTNLKIRKKFDFSPQQCQSTLFYLGKLLG
jgi:hypothetical protein